MLLTFSCRNSINDSKTNKSIKDTANFIEDTEIEWKYESRVQSSQKCWKQFEKIMRSCMKKPQGGTLKVHIQEI